MAKLAIFSATPLSYRGGYEEFICRLYERALKNGYEIDLVEGPSWLFGFFTTIIGRRERFAHLQNNQGLSQGWYDRLKGADVVYCKSEILDLAIVRLAVSSRKIVAGMHTPRRYPRRNQTLLRGLLYGPFLFRLFLGRAKLHLLTPAQEAEVADLKATTVVLENGVPEPLAVRTKRVSCGADGTFTAFFAGRFTDQKGVDRLKNLLALPRLGRLIIFGEGPMGDVIRALAEEDGRVEVHGWADRQSLQLAMTQADVVVIPSRWEGLSLLVLEALRTGSLVLAQSIPVMESLRSEAIGVYTTDFDSPERIEKDLKKMWSSVPDPSAISAGAGERFDSGRQCDRLLKELLRR